MLFLNTARRTFTHHHFVYFFYNTPKSPEIEILKCEIITALTVFIDFKTFGRVIYIIFLLLLYFFFRYRDVIV